ncbi:Uncharacterised protein [Mycolicibacterium aurum]|uniref:Helix-turn-helix domain-containing protein n=1 Tax=Mycolicibacterium aurum TaxID=1791 RepID=A0A3S4U046_MYCAU|nr:Uncharacterised protein [Mycolicibacterium aurum]
MEPWQLPGVNPDDPGYYPSLVMGAAVVTYAADVRNVTITKQLVKRAAESGKLPYSLISGRRCFSPRDVDNWLLSNRRVAGERAVSA